MLVAAVGESSEEPHPVLRAGVLALDRHRVTVTLAGAAVALTRAEIVLLAALMARAGAEVPYGDLAGALWGERLVLPRGNALEVHIHRLRVKLRRVAAAAGVGPPAIEADRQGGYRLRA